MYSEDGPEARIRSVTEFRFKQFSVRHDRCGMKVGTDAILLGSWAGLSFTNTDHKLRFLDIGTGCGVIALMLAQRFPAARIDAVEVDRESADQALQNFECSPWSDRTHLWNGTIQQFDPQSEYDLIVCNPPFFRNSHPAANASRNVARHEVLLTAPELAAAVDHLLADDGVFCVILPVDRESDASRALGQFGFVEKRRRLVQSTPDHAPGRCLLAFGRCRQGPRVDEDPLVVELQRHRYSADYQDLARDFLLQF